MECDNVIICNADTALCDSTLASGDEAAITTLDCIQGTFFNTGIELHELPIYKSCPADDRRERFWFKHKPNGWYCANQVFSTEKAMNQLNKGAKRGENEEVVIFGWASGELLPRQVHFPYWGGATPGLMVQPIWDFTLEQSAEKQILQEKVFELEGELTVAHGEIEQLKQLLADKEEAADEAEDGGKGSNGWADNGDWSNKPATVYGGGGGHGGGKGSNKGGHGSKRGGWMPKAAQLSATVKQDNFGEAKKMVSKFEEESWQFADLLNKAMWR